MEIMQIYLIQLAIMIVIQFLLQSFQQFIKTWERDHKEQNYNPLNLKNDLE